MGWLDRLIGRRAAPARPWSFPCRLVIVPDQLEMTGFAHDLNTAGPTLACWTFVSDGLIGYGQKELVLTVARVPDESPEAIARDIAKLLSTVQQYAARGQRVDVGDITVFEGSGPAGARGVAYVRPAPLDGVVVPSSALAAIPLIGAEAEVAAVFGMTRIIGRLARHYRHYPCPPWWDRSRQTIAASAGEDTSILARLARHRVPGVSGRRERDGIRVRVHPSAHDKLVQVLDAAPGEVAQALLTDLDSEADGLLVWHPGAQQLEAATPAGSRAERVSIAFIALAPGTTETGGRILEDGAVLMFMAPAWDAFREAVRRCESVTIPPTVGYGAITLEWIAETYVSPIDGRAYVAEEGWRKFYPDQPAPSHGHRPVSRMVLLADIREQGSVDGLAAYVDAIEGEFSRAFGERAEFIEVFLRIEIHPGEPARVTERSDDDEVRMSELIARVPLPPVTGSVVAFECRLTNRPDVGSMPD